MAVNKASKTVCYVLVSEIIQLRANKIGQCEQLFYIIGMLSYVLFLCGMQTYIVVSLTDSKLSKVEIEDYCFNKYW